MVMNQPQQFPVARQSAGPAPLRRPGSIRRTTSIDSDWPDGQDQPWQMIGRARDLLTPFDDGNPRVLATGGFRIMASPLREILSIDLNPDHRDAQALVGVRAGGASRTAISLVLGDLRGTPTFQLLDDFAGASLVAGWIWSLWSDDWLERMARFSAGANGAPGRKMVDICTGFAEGASSLTAEGLPGSNGQSRTPVGPLENPQDPLGWHQMPVQQGPRKRRARRIDVWRDADAIKIDAAFQDSGSNPDGGRTAIHEYRLYAEVDAQSGILAALQVLPLILPYRECPGAAVKATRMIGHKLADFRNDVLETLPGPQGCTHLNDVLRALADVPALALQLPDR
jgi:hypothetical protein